jgi:hypothetical protein
MGTSFRTVTVSSPPWDGIQLVSTMPTRFVTNAPLGSLLYSTDALRFDFRIYFIYCFIFVYSFFFLSTFLKFLDLLLFNKFLFFFFLHLFCSICKL